MAFDHLHIRYIYPIPFPELFLMLMSLYCFPEILLLTLNCLSLYIKTHEHEFKIQWNIPPPPRGSFFETDSPHHTDWSRFAQDLSPIHVGVYDIKNLVVETLKPKQPDYKGNFNFHGPDLLQKNILVCICTY